MGEVCLVGRKTGLDRDKTIAGAGPGHRWSVLSRPINVEIAVEGPNGYLGGRKQRTSGECRWNGHSMRGVEHD